MINIKLRTVKEKMNKKILIRKMLKYLFIISCCILIALIAINIVVKSSGERIVAVEESVSLEADCILILGAGVDDFGNPSPMLEDRLNKGIELYQMGAAEKIIMSGDHGREDYDEVNVMKDYAR